METVRPADLRKKTPRSRWNRLKIVIAAVQALRPQRLAAKPLVQNLEFKSIIDKSSSDRLYKVVDRLHGGTYALKEFKGISYSEGISQDLKKQTPQSRWNRLKIVIVAIQAMRSQSLATRSFQNFELKSIIDDSSSDKVYKVVNRLTGRTYAMKEFNGISYSDEISHEIHILKGLNHPNLVKCYHIFHVDHKVFLLLENMDRGSLVGISVASEFDLARFGHQVLLGLSYLHQNYFWHGDIKPSNIFVNHLDQVKVLFPGNLLSNVSASAMSDIHARFSWDIWSVGLCILKLSKGLNWSHNDFKFDQVHFPTSSQHKGAVVQKPSVELWRFLRCCMKTESKRQTADESKRQTADELIRHPFFKQLSGEKKGRHRRLRQKNILN